MGKFEFDSQIQIFPPKLLVAVCHYVAQEKKNSVLSIQCQGVNLELANSYNLSSRDSEPQQPQ